MAAATYTTDLTLVNDAESGTWAELVGYTAGSAVTVPDTDYYIQGSGCATQATGGKTGLQVGMAYDYGSDLGAAWTAGDCFFIWSVFLGGNSIDTLANGGIRLGVGSANGDMKMWYLVGSDYGRNPYGGWQNVVFDPTETETTSDQTIGTPTAGVYQWFGSLLNMVAAVSKGNLHGVDAIRYGRGQLIVELGDLANGYATFGALATTNDYNDVTNGYNRWGLFQSQAGGYLWKGLLTLGTTTNAVDFRDSNRVIVVDDTRKTYAAFNRIEVNNAASRVDWTNIQITALGTLSPGQFEAIDNATINKDTCIFTDMGTFVYQSNSTILTSTYRRCGQITQGSATFTGCTFDSLTTQVLANNISLITDSHFISDGTGHAVELTTTGTYNWDGNTFSGYGTTGTTDAVIYNNSGGAITINVINGADVPTYLNGSGASTTVTVSYTLTLTNIPSGVNVTIVNSSTRAELQHTTSTGADIVYTHSGGETVDILLNSLLYDPNLSDIYNLTLPSANSSIKFQMIDDPNYDNPV